MRGIISAPGVMCFSNHCQVIGFCNRTRETRSQCRTRPRPREREEKRPEREYLLDTKRPNDGGIFLRSDRSISRVIYAWLRVAVRATIDFARAPSISPGIHDVNTFRAVMDSGSGIRDCMYIWFSCVRVLPFDLHSADHSCNRASIINRVSRALNYMQTLCLKNTTTVEWALNIIGIFI